MAPLGQWLVVTNVALFLKLYSQTAHKHKQKALLITIAVAVTVTAH